MVKHFLVSIEVDEAQLAKLNKQRSNLGMPLVTADDLAENTLKGAVDFNEILTCTSIAIASPTLKSGDER